jgi:multimeric flavodoxin WrbA
MKKPAVRKQNPYIPLTKKQFRERFYARFYDPEFNDVKTELKKVFEKAWEGYIQYRKSPRKEKAGKGFSDPNFKLPIEWLAARKEILKAEKIYKNSKSPSRILLIIGSTRSEHSCPGEISKTRRLIQIASKSIQSQKGFEVDILDLSTLADEPWKVIHPCKACVSTTMPLCHWPCSCYPNHALGQTNDWMAEIYPKWVAAHGVMIICPVHWYQAPASIKLMIDRLVCADGGNPDPTTTKGKNPALAKELELKGWDYPKHLAGRAFSVVTHADAAGPENLRRMLSDWLTDIGMIQAGPSAVLDTFIGYYQPYATNHEDLDKNEQLPIQIKNAALSLANMVTMIRTGAYVSPDEGLEDPKEK